MSGAAGPASALARVTVCGLGPGDPGALTAATAELLAGPSPVFLRTRRHPGADRLAVAGAFDEVYEQAESFDEVYRTIAGEVAAAAGRHGHVVYAVPGSPLVLERSVRALRSAAAVEVDLLPAVSFLDEVWATLGVDPVDDGVRLVDGLRFGVEAAGERGPLLVAHAHAPWVLSDIKLAADAGPEQRVVVLQRLGTPDERVFEVPWPELDRVVEPDHLTSLYLPELTAPVGQQLARSVELMRRLRRDCPWDRSQDHHSLRRYLIEEAYEVLDAIDGLPAGAADPAGPANDLAAEAYADLEEELGDLWFQILFHAELAAEVGQFTIAEVAEGLCDKMISRHPHVYGDRGAVDGSVPAEWERLKQAEKQRGSVLDGIPRSLPALALATKVLKKADGAGAPAELGGDATALADLLSGADAGRAGQLLLDVVELCRRSGVDPELALRHATDRAADRFRAREATGGLDGRWVRG